jgi:hypothetical protein
MTFVGVTLMLGLLGLVAMTAKISLTLMAPLDGETQEPGTPFSSSERSGDES